MFLMTINEMKQFIYSICLFVAFVSFAQTSENYQKHLSKPRFSVGYVEMQNGERIEGVLTSPRGLDDKIVLVKKDGSELSIYSRELAAYKLGSSRYVGNGKGVFYQEEIRGDKISLYTKGSLGTTMTPTPSGGMMMGGYSTTSYYVRKEGEDFMFVRSTNLFGAPGFKAKFTAYFSNCPYVAEKIAKKEWKARDIDIIVRAYNDKCK